ncbi:MAG TPA: hypothetical protein VD866_03345, partial [Urbifossiella sp.]|nr:hypothetical protein [Urbifossiella sp.]
MRPDAATAPTFAAFNPGARPAALAAVAEGPGGTDLDGDGRAEVMAGAGAGAWPLVGVYDPLTGARRDVF